MPDNETPQGNTLLFPAPDAISSGAGEFDAPAGGKQVVRPAAGGPENVVLLAVDTGEFDAERSLDELRALCEDSGMSVVAEVLQARESKAAATALGRGRVAEAALLAKNLDAQLAVFDGELSGSQIKNLEKMLDIPVIDRTMLILEIFSRRAVTAEGKLQTELATLEYRLPRLSGLGASLSRQGGGGGGGAGARRGGGETKLEYDRRYIRGRIAVLKKRLEQMKAHRKETRRAREKTGVPLVAFVGYTNVGKSSLVNALCGSDIPVADMLFATLDPTARQTTLPDGQAAVCIDTVGFVSRLPHGLVEAFKSTLEEAVYADLLVVVCDASDPAAEEQLAVTARVLAELGATAPRITVYNKCDLVQNTVLLDATAYAASAATGAGLDDLKAGIANQLAARMRAVKLVLPYDKLSLADVLRRHGRVQCEEYRGDGVYVEAIVEAAKVHLFEAFLSK